MNNNDEKKFGELMAVSGSIFDKELTKPILRIMFETLKEYSIDQVDAAFTKHLQTGDFFPRPSQLIRIINAGKPNNEDKAVLAWLSITNAISKIGPYRALTLDDKLAMQIINHVGGWSNLCNLSYKELDFKKREFIQAYTTTAITNEKDLPKSLAGIHDLARLENKGES
jgi:hypothetical protein